MRAADYTEGYVAFDKSDMRAPAALAGDELASFLTARLLVLFIAFATQRQVPWTASLRADH